MRIDRDKIILKKVTKSDIDTIIDYRIAFLKEIQGNPSAEQELILRESLRQYLTKSIEEDSFVSWIAEYEGKSIGFSGMTIRTQPGNFRMINGKTGYILNMYTVKEYRKNGIGSLLFQKLLEEGKQRDLDRLELHATTDGEPIYRQFGFAEPHDKALELTLK